MTRSPVLYAALIVFTGACHHAPPAAGAAPNPDTHPLAGIVGDPLLIAPVQGFRSAVANTPADFAAAARAMFDSALSDTLRARVGAGQWVYAAALVRSAKENPTYATDPRSLSVQILRGAKLSVDDRLPEPLASQLRTMLALHDGRLILLPIELRVDNIPTGARPVLRLVLVDPRSSVIRWFKDVNGDDTAAFSAAFIPSMASRVADLFVAK